VSPHVVINVGVANEPSSKKVVFADTFREAFEGKQDRLVEEIDTADYSGLLVKLQAKGVITDRHKRHLHASHILGCHCTGRISLRRRLTLKITVNL